jgi:hypothetical protein
MRPHLTRNKWAVVVRKEAVGLVHLGFGTEGTECAVDGLQHQRDGDKRVGRN